MMRNLTLVMVCTFWFLNASAEDVNVCTTSELRAAISAATPGDKILMCSRQWRDLDLLFEVYGTEADPITLEAEVPGEALITGRSQIRMAGRYAVVRGLRFQDGYPISSAVWFRKDSSTPCNNCRLTETAMINYDAPTGSSDFNRYKMYVRLQGKNNRVDHNYFTGHHGMGPVIMNEDVRASGPEKHRIDHNYFGHRRRHPSGNHGEAIKAGDDDTKELQSGTVIENNYFYRSNGDFEIITVKSSGVVLRRNTFDRCEGALSLRNANGAWVDGNTFLGHRDDSKKVSGIRINGRDHVITNNYLFGIKVGGSDARGGINISSGNPGDDSKPLGGRVAAKNILIAFNTIVDSDRSISVDGSFSEAPSNIVIANNIIVGPYGPLISEDKPINGVTYSQNIAFGANVGKNSSGIIVTNPQLTLANGIHRISSSSPALASADAGYTPLSRIGSSISFIDSEGQLRSGSYDIGADEYISGSGPGYTSVCDVGPRSYNPNPSNNCTVSQQPIPKAPILLTSSD